MALQIFILPVITSCCGTIEQVHATEGSLNTLNFSEKKKKKSL